MLMYMLNVYIEHIQKKKQYKMLTHMFWIWVARYHASKQSFVVEKQLAVVWLGALWS